MRKNPLEAVIVGFTFVMACFMFFAAGANFQENNNFMGVQTFISGAFFFAILAAVIWNRFASLKDELKRARAETAKDVAAGLAKALDKAFEDKPVGGTASPEPTVDLRHKQNHDALMEATKSVGIDEETAPTPSDFPRIADRFHELTGRYVLLEKEAGMGDMIKCSFSDTPFNPTPPADLKPGVATTEAAKKPLTKSQQRRINAQKGHGPITDEELRVQRNEARRAKREAAKKQSKTDAEPATTTTTTLKGQTTLE